LSWYNLLLSSGVYGTASKDDTPKDEEE